MSNWLASTQIESLFNVDETVVQYYRKIGVLEARKEPREVERVTKLGKLICYKNRFGYTHPNQYKKLKERLKENASFRGLRGIRI